LRAINAKGQENLYSSQDKSTEKNGIFVIREAS